MVFDIFRFNYFALDLLRSEDERDDADLTVAGYLEREGYSRVFKDDYLLVRILSFSVTAGYRSIFLSNHHEVLSRPLRPVVTRSPSTITHSHAVSRRVSRRYQSIEFPTPQSVAHAQPLIASIWSIPLDIAATFPITTLVQSFNNHHLLQLWRKPKWYSILGGS